MFNNARAEIRTTFFVSWDQNGQYRQERFPQESKARAFAREKRKYRVNRNIELTKSTKITTTVHEALRI